MEDKKQLSEEARKKRNEYMREYRKQMEKEMLGSDFFNTDIDDFFNSDIDE